MPKIKILPSLLAADHGNFSQGAQRGEAAGADELHLDIMDGHFVPNISFGPEVVRVVRRSCGLPLDVHLMLSRPDQYIDAFGEAGAHSILIHIEAECDVEDTLQRIRDMGIHTGIALDPDTAAESIDGVLKKGLVDEVLCMTVHPGFGGQSFIESVMPKLAALRKAHPELDLMVDGGITDETVEQAAAHGANLFVAGTYLYAANKMNREVERLRTLARQSFGTQVT